MSNLRVLVTGATGSQGGAVARWLLKAGVPVRALTRNVRSAKAVTLAEAGAELALGNFTQADSVEEAAQGCSSAFIMSTPFEAGMEAETAQGLAAVDAAVAAGVEHLVYTSVAGGQSNSGIPHFESKTPVENHVLGLNVAKTVLGPAYFMENLYFPQSLDALQGGTFGWPLSPDRPLQQVAVENIGAFGALVFQDAARFDGQRIELAGDGPTGPQCAEVLSKATKREIGFFQIPMDVIRAMSEDLALMYEWFESDGYDVDIAGLREQYPEVAWLNYQDWAAKQSWGLLG